MKKTILSLTVGAVAILGLSTNADAGPRFSYGYSTGHYNSGYRNIQSYTGYSYRNVSPYSSYRSYNSHAGRGYGQGQSQCSTPYKVRTQEVNRRLVRKTGYLSCGRPYTYHITVVTYRDYYSNGTVRTWTRTLS